MFNGLHWPLFIFIIFINIVFIYLPLLRLPLGVVELIFLNNSESKKFKQALKIYIFYLYYSWLYRLSFFKTSAVVVLKSTKFR